MSSSSISRCLITLFLLSLPVSVVSYCHQDELRCSRLKCINKRLQCDGKTDCEDRSDELNCDFRITAANNTNSTQAPNGTMSSGLLTPGQSNGTASHSFRPRIKFRLTRKRVYNDNRTKRKKHPLHKKNAAVPVSDTSTTASSYTTSTPKEIRASMRHNVPCTHEECEKRKLCFDGKRSHECHCNDATCSTRGVMEARNDKDSRLKDVFEWIVISIASAGLFLALTFMILKRRRIRHNNVRPLHVRTVVCYHHGQATTQLDGTCVGRHMTKRGHEGDSMECRPLCGKKVASQGIMSEGEANTCYIAMSKHVAHNK